MVISEKKKILLVDDEEDVLRAISRRLSAVGYDVLAASSGKKALGILERDVPDLILLDIMMPEMDGFEVCRRIKMLKDMTDIPIVFFTARSALEDKLTGLKEGVFDYIEKPIDHRELIARVEMHIRVYDHFREVSVRDELTGIPNYNYFIKQFTHHFHLSKRYGRDFSIIVVDVDDFKVINDSFGHLSGNVVLKTISDRLQKRVRKSDIVTRYGGDEFVLILPETSRQQSHVLLHDLREDIGAFKCVCGDQMINVSNSFGFAAFSDGFETQEEMFEKADKNMYEEKILKHRESRKK